MRVVTAQAPVWGEYGEHGVDDGTDSRPRGDGDDGQADLFYIPVIVYGRDQRFILHKSLVDGGAIANLMPEAVVVRMGLELKPTAALSQTINGLRPDETKLDKLRSYLMPSTPEELDAFLYFTNYLRRYVKEKADLYGVLKSAVLWGPEPESPGKEKTDVLPIKSEPKARMKCKPKPKPKLKCPRATKHIIGF
ncbi:hypothetical protein Dda_7033 [Drechslerella dactyloides]|uniref:Uncharacterized protein n=1 Tax=Drechslerella dactyloides TaxID=74499 RepID=A0AAD6ITA2_DREDA|nr:hypothetical protein Dda_7033 [Drechslerella dactyloides]